MSNHFHGTAYPKVNVYEYDDKVGIIAEIPVMDKKDLKIEVEDGVLIISGDKHRLFDDSDSKVLRRELKGSSFKRQFELGELLDGENIKASFKDGLLSIDVPKVEPAKPKKLSVKIGCIIKNQILTTNSSVLVRIGSMFLVVCWRTWLYA